MTLGDDIVYLKGVGPQRAKVLAAEADIHTVGDLLNYLPFRHVDRSVLSTVSTLSEEGGFVVLKGLVSNMQTVSTGKFRERLTVDFRDGTGNLQLVWFAGTKWVRERLKPNVEYLVMGNPTLFLRRRRVTPSVFARLHHDRENETEWPGQPCPRSPHRHPHHSTPFPHHFHP